MSNATHTHHHENEDTQNCPDWCTQHRHVSDESIAADRPGPAEFHGQWLFTSSDPPGIEEVRERRVISLGLSQLVDSGEELEAPGMRLHGEDIKVDGDVRISIRLKDARGLAAAIIRGADIIEGYLTETCPTCGESITARESARYGGCIGCKMETHRADRAARKATLRQVNGNGTAGGPR